MVRYYTREAGVRSLERELSKFAARWSGACSSRSWSLRSSSLPTTCRTLGVRKFTYGRAELQNQVGQVVGLAWTEVGAIC